MLLHKQNPSVGASRISSQGKVRIITLNSTAGFMLAYLLVYLFHQAATVFMAQANGIPATLFPGHIYFKIYDHEWQADQVFSVYAAGPLTALVLGLLALTAFKLGKKFTGSLKGFLLWVIIFGLNTFLGSLLAGSAVQGGFWYAIKWSVGSYGLVWMIAGILGILLVVAGVLLAPLFLETCPSASLKQFQNRRKLLKATLVYPFLFGAVAIAALKFPDLTLYEGLQFLTLLLFLVPAYFQNLGNPLNTRIHVPQKTRLSAAAIGLVMLGAIGFRVLLQNGMAFG